MSGGARPAPGGAGAGPALAGAMDHETVTLSAGGSTVALIPALGGKIAALRLAGREWLWTSPTLPRVAPTPEVAADDAASYVRLADSGGYDECLPTVGACTIPAEVAGAGGVALPDHGELWAQAGVTERLDGATPGAVTRWRGRRLPYAFSRTITVEPDGAVRMAYALEALGDAAMPFLWSSHPLLALPPDTRLDLPIAARVRVWGADGVALGGPGSEHRWPMLREGAPDATRFGPRELDFSRPALVAAAVGGRYACKLFLDLPQGTGLPVRLAVEQDDARLECEVDAREVPHLGLWINQRGWTPFAAEGGAPYLNLGFEPCIGAGDTLSAALGAAPDAGDRWRDGANWLLPGETRRWTLLWRGRARPVG